MHEVDIAQNRLDRRAARRVPVVIGRRCLKLDEGDLHAVVRTDPRGQLRRERSSWQKDS